jgi:hypothetical protein
LIESLDLRPSNQYVLVSECPSCLSLEKMCVPGKAAVEMKSKVFDMVLLRYWNIIYMDRWARFSSCSECHMDRLSLIGFNSPITWPGLNSEEGGLQFLGSSGRITVIGDDCSVVGEGGSEGVKRGWKVSCIK